MHFASILLVITTYYLLNVESKNQKTEKTFKFGQTQGYYSLSPASKRFIEQRIIYNHGNINGNMNGNNINANKEIWNANYFKSTRNADLGNVLTPAPPVIEFQDSSASLYETNMIQETSGSVSNPQEYYSPSRYLKSMNQRTEALDDLEINYVNEFLKKGLILGTDFEKGTVWDEQFLNTLKRFYASLMQRTTPFIPNLSNKWKTLAGETAYRTPHLYAKSKSIDCGNLQLKLKINGIIYDGHRNRVIKLLDRGSKKNFAYKTYGNSDEFYTEQEMFLWLDHPYYVKAVCHRKDLDTGKPGILFEYIEGISSLEYARTASPDQLKMISAQLFLAIEHLHWLGIVHADMKPENVLIRADGTVQVIDLGFATHLPQSKRRRGTHSTMAPELHYLVPGRVHEGIDWWAYGSTVAMWYGYNILYRNEDGRRFIPMNWQDKQFYDGVVPGKFPVELRNFLQIFFQPNPDARRIHTRRLLKQVRDEPFFQGIDWTMFHGGVLI